MDTHVVIPVAADEGGLVAIGAGVAVGGLGYPLEISIKRLGGADAVVDNADGRLLAECVHIAGATRPRARAPGPCSRRRREYVVLLSSP